MSRATKEENPCGKTSVRAKSEPRDMTVEKIIKARAGNSLAVQVRTPGFHCREYGFYPLLHSQKRKLRPRILRNSPHA